ncbi:MAG: acyltransferase [Pseudomonadota bacterium]
MTQGSRTNWLAIAVGLAVALMVYFVISTWVQNTVARVLVVGYFPSDTQVSVSSVNKDGQVRWRETYQVGANIVSKPQITGTRRVNLPLNYLRIEFQQSGSDTTADPGPVALHNIQVRMPYATSFFYSANRIRDYFDSEQYLANKTNEFEYDPESQRITLNTTQAVGEPNWVLSIGISILIGLGIWLIVKNSAWTEIPAFSDMSLGNNISSAAEFNAINGVRGLAAILVLFSHTAPGFENVRMGLALLFVISGFLLSKPFVIDNRKIYSWANLERYVTKRLKRILPMYYLYVFIAYVATFDFSTAARHFLFVQGAGHLWPMTQIFTFYMLLPFVLLITCFAHRLHRLLPIALLAVASYFWLTHMVDWEPYYNGRFSNTFFLYTFLFGVLTSYVYYDLISNATRLRTWLQRYGALVALVSVVVTLLSIVWSAPIKPPALVHMYLDKFWVKSILAAMIIVFALLVPGNWFAKLISNWWFRSVGVVGFSFYLLHGIGIDIVRNLNDTVLQMGMLEDRTWGFVLASFLVTYVMALIAYSWVERPFFGYRRKPAK